MSPRFPRPMHRSRRLNPLASAPARDASAREAERRLIGAPRQWRNWESNSSLRSSMEALRRCGERPIRSSFAERFSSPGFRESTPLYQGPLAISPGSRRLFWSMSDGIHEWDLNAHRLVSALACSWDRVRSRGGWLESVIGELGSRPSLACRRNEDRQRYCLIAERRVPDPACRVFTRRRTGRHCGRRRLRQCLGRRLWRADCRDSSARNGSERSVRAVQYVPDRRHSRGVARVVFFQDEGNVRTRPAPPGTKLVAADVGPSDAVITADDSGALHLLRTDTGQERLLGRHERVTAVAFANGGRFVASGGIDGVMRLWDVQSRFPAPVALDAHDVPSINALAFTHDDAYVIAASRLGVMRVWDTNRASAAAGGSLQFASLSTGPTGLSPNGRFLITRDIQRGLRCFVAHWRSANARDRHGAVTSTRANRCCSKRRWHQCGHRRTRWCGQALEWPCRIRCRAGQG